MLRMTLRGLLAHSGRLVMSVFTVALSVAFAEDARTLPAEVVQGYGRCPASRSRMPSSAPSGSWSSTHTAAGSRRRRSPPYSG